GLPVVRTLSYMGSLIPQATNRLFEIAKSFSKLIVRKRRYLGIFSFRQPPSSRQKAKFVH
ncbi:MAG: hypothetical protein ACLUHB_19475, partial [Odoribacter splanchnicus]